MFSKEQTDALKAPLSRSVVRKNPKGYDYTEGWQAISEANRIFGFAGWDRQTVETRQLGEPEQVGANWRVAYHCRVRIIVYAGDRQIVRDGSGYGSGIVKDVRDAHESAIKEAETDAMKRAFMTFGNPFGLALYDKTQENVADPVDESRALFMTTALDIIRVTTDAAALRTWWSSEEQKSMRRKVGITKPELDELIASIKSRLETLEGKQAA